MIEERVGYLGYKREKKIKQWNLQYGNSWSLMWKWGDSFIDQNMATQIYEDAYYIHLKNNPKILEKLITTAKDVYDTALSNINSGFDYSIQETKAAHLQDIAVRRSILRLGKMFKGKEYIQIRGLESEGSYLNPGFIKFHMPEMILKPSLSKDNWWNENSIEDFYQSNKYLIVK